MERFASQNADKITVIGLGTQDSLAQAQDFRVTYGGTGITMLWDGSFQSWANLGVTGQPGGMLLTSGGEIRHQWSGGIPQGDVLAWAADLP